MQLETDARAPRCVRYTWAYFTFGAHSTQRAEAIHSALKRILHANMLLTQLVEALIMYSEVKEFKVEMHKTLALNQAFQGANQHPFVEEVRKSGKVTPHDVQLLRSEAGQVNGYTLEPVPAQPGVDAADHDGARRARSLRHTGDSLGRSRSRCRGRGSCQVRSGVLKLPERCIPIRAARGRRTLHLTLPVADVVYGHDVCRCARDAFVRLPGRGCRVVSRRVVL
mmetsp:Transcript_14678/g.44775  ORF Transcript_14678/g.44775 Transcript_14678/m.44775 type:complete len:224 (-) Transcript_14678:9-680(-)